MRKFLVLVGLLVLAATLAGATGASAKKWRRHHHRAGHAPVEVMAPSPAGGQMSRPGGGSNSK